MGSGSYRPLCSQTFSWPPLQTVSGDSVSCHAVIATSCASHHQFSVGDCVQGIFLMVSYFLG